MRSRVLNKKFFNMVEIVLAIGILAFGFASVLGMFPVAIKAVRSSQMEGVASDIINDIYSYYYSMAHVPLVDRNAADPTVVDEYWYILLFFDTTPGSSYTLPTLVTNTSTGCYGNQYNSRDHFYTESNLETLRTDLESSSNILNGYKYFEEFKKQADTYNKTLGSNESVRQKFLTNNSSSGNPFVLVDNFDLFKPSTDLFQSNSPHTVYYLIRGDENYRRIDLSAQIIIWKSQSEQTYPTSAGTVTHLGYEHATVLNFEVSWPLTLQYTEREKRYYQIVIANPKRIP